MFRASDGDDANDANFGERRMTDTNHRRERLSPTALSLAVAIGDKGCLAIFGTKPESHRLLTDHLTAEYRVKTEGRGRTVDEWKLRPERDDNHLFDCLVGCAVAASIQGAVLFGTDVKPTARRTRLKLSEIQRMKR